MQQARFESSSPEGHSRRRRVPASQPAMPGAIPNPSQTLPSIRHLHPFLTQPSDDPSSYSYPPPGGSGYSQSTGGMDGIMNPPAQLPPPQQQQREPEYYGGVESEAEEDLGPPKKKRRRQALSCTECKRRKIKCDRNQPCAPCSRRGEQAKCQWHIVEPVEKYVTRAEYDELKAKFDQLWMIVHRMLPQQPAATSTTMPYYTSLAGAPVEAVQQQQSYQTNVPVYSSIMAPPPSYPSHIESTSPSMHPVQRYSARPEESQSPRHHASGSGSGASPVVATLQPATSQSRSSMSTSSGSGRPVGGGGGTGISVSDHKAPASSGGGGATAGPSSSNAGARRSPLARTSITGPPGSSYDPTSSSSSQPKNFRAQTLILGERLRDTMAPNSSSSSHREGPASLIITTPAPRRASRTTARRVSRRPLPRDRRSQTCIWMGLEGRLSLPTRLPQARPPSRLSRMAQVGDA
ncbi:hypothetical protein DFP72DRAFT_136322 [Ephemerocybe angulata]|uniref:Zn(2)-C6 fungal-type domain-containing protein n=1 Tax=Ephemerocybe angulata TaxID=980116 RepID=A0A8H6MD09_9AGAR|nr:hypothetical protein DFP72DRAFT_136322 [Tulosesus angulatus]